MICKHERVVIETPDVLEYCDLCLAVRSISVAGTFPSRWADWSEVPEEVRNYVEQNRALGERRIFKAPEANLFQKDLLALREAHRIRGTLQVRK